MSNRLAACGVVVGLLVASLAAQEQGAEQLRRLYDEHRWFDLRESVLASDTPALYRCAVASAVNQPDEAERCLRRVVRDTRDAWMAAQALDLLVSLHLRAGRTADAIRVVDELLSRTPEREDLRNVRSMLTSVTPVRNQRVRSTGPAVFDCRVDRTGVRLPVSINGRAPVHWLLDTGFTTPALSEREAEMLGLAIRDQGGMAVDGSGGSTGFRVTRAERLVIGRIELRDVLLLVFPDSQPPWSELQPGTRGIIGLPVALAMERIRWTDRGTCEVGRGTRSANSAAGNVVFNGLEPVVRVEFEGKMLEFLLDTGNQATSQLWERFAGEFREFLTERGTPDTVRVSQIGGTTERRVIVLPEMQLGIGGRTVRLSPARVFARPVGDDRFHGNLGMDVVSQASEVTLDFRSMTLTLR